MIPFFASKCGPSDEFGRHQSSGLFEFTNNSTLLITSFNVMITRTLRSTFTIDSGHVMSISLCTFGVFRHPIKSGITTVALSRHNRHVAWTPRLPLTTPTVPRALPKPLPRLSGLPVFPLRPAPCWTLPDRFQTTQPWSGCIHIRWGLVNNVVCWRGSGGDRPDALGSALLSLHGLVG
jgi:hypothetical protein